MLRADLEHELVMVDDDMKMEALKSTHYLKSLITAEMPMDLERKGEQSYQGEDVRPVSLPSPTAIWNRSTTIRTDSTADSLSCRLRRNRLTVRMTRFLADKLVCRNRGHFPLVSGWSAQADSK